MCGIAGIVDLRGLDCEAAARDLARANERLAPRGPDGSGTWISSHAGFTHRRLAVIALGAEAGLYVHASQLAFPAATATTTPAATARPTASFTGA